MEAESIKVNLVVGHVFISKPVNDLNIAMLTMAAFVDLSLSYRDYCYKCGVVKSYHREQVSLPTTPDRVIKENEEEEIGNYAD